MLLLRGLRYDTILAALHYRSDKLVPHHGWMIDFRPEIHVDGQVVVADFAGWRAIRRVQPALRKPFCRRSNTRYADAPDWVGDIVEPSSAALVRYIKLPIYHRLGVTSLWLINRIASVLEVYSAAAASWQLDATFKGAGRLRTAPFKKFEFELDWLWQPI